jgi:hypothetical protein
MGYQTFLAKTKHMFNIFVEVREPKPESAKIRFLLDGIRSTELQPIVQAIRAGMTLDPYVYTFTTAANMIASQVTLKETNRSISALGKESGDKTNTEFLPVKKWRALSAEQQAAIRAARDKNPDIKRSRRGKSLYWTRGIERSRTSRRRFRRSSAAPTRQSKTNPMTKILIPAQVMHLVAAKKRNRPRKRSRNDNFQPSNCNSG